MKHNAIALYIRLAERAISDLLEGKTDGIRYVRSFMDRDVYIDNRSNPVTAYVDAGTRGTLDAVHRFYPDGRHEHIVVLDLPKPEVEVKLRPSDKVIARGSDEATGLQGAFESVIEEYTQSKKKEARRNEI
ncbi:MAG: hypothetical protein HY514_04830 [Candidatus Aenigmarchaeota archaeon]|nr:hypothetical protein [Candidatus Aenigmarchaeota archaeon]